MEYCNSTAAVPHPTKNATFISLQEGSSICGSTHKRLVPIGKVKLGAGSYGQSGLLCFTLSMLRRNTAPPHYIP